MAKKIGKFEGAEVMTAAERRKFNKTMKAIMSDPDYPKYESGTEVDGRKAMQDLDAYYQKKQVKGELKTSKTKTKATPTKPTQESVDNLHQALIDAARKERNASLRAANATSRTDAKGIQSIRNLDDDIPKTTLSTEGKNLQPIKRKYDRGSANRGNTKSVSLKKALENAW